MQKTISRCWAYTGQYSFQDYLCCGLHSGYLVKQLENCKDITYMFVRDFSNPEGLTFDLDFTKCESLETLRIQGMPSGINPVFKENNFSRLEWFSSNLPITIGNISLEYLEVINMGINSYADLYFNDLFALKDGEEKKLFSIGQICLDVYKDVDFLNTVISKLKNVDISQLKVVVIGGGSSLNNFDYSSWGGSLLNLTSIIVPVGNIPNLDFLSNNSSLTTLTLKSCGITDISGINGSLIVSLHHSLIKLKNLQKITLENNPIDEGNLPERNEANGKYWTNITILESLHPSNGGGLQGLYLKNTKISNFGVLENLEWPLGKSGF